MELHWEGSHMFVSDNRVISIMPHVDLCFPAKITHFCCELEVRVNHLKVPGLIFSTCIVCFLSSERLGWCNRVLYNSESALRTSNEHSTNNVHIQSFSFCMSSHPSSSSNRRSEGKFPRWTPLRGNLWLGNGVVFKNSLTGWQKKRFSGRSSSQAMYTLSKTAETKRREASKVVMLE